MTSAWKPLKNIRRLKTLERLQKNFKKGIEVLTVTGNIGDVQAVAEMCTKIEETFSKVYILVNCTGGDIGACDGKLSPNNALDIPIEDVQALINNNLIGTINVCKAFIPAMQDQKYGVVVNIGSVAGQLGVSEGAIYGILKASVTHYTRCLATESNMEFV